MGTVAVVLDDPTGGPFRRRLRDLLQRLLVVTARADCSVELMLTSDRVVRRLNRRFRGRDRITDVLSFPDGEELEPGIRHLGEIAIAMPRAARQARRARWPLDSELSLLVTHGYLHLLGYDHETDDGTMRRLEEALLRQVAQVQIARRALPWGEPAVPQRRRQGGARRNRK